MSGIWPAGCSLEIPGLYYQQTWGDYIRNVINCNYLPHARLRLHWK